jgi:hypothetical protein
VRRIFDTDRIKLTRKLRARLEEDTIEDPAGSDCRFYPGKRIQVEVYQEPKSVGISPSRVAWALAHPEDHLQEDEEAVHTCPNNGGHDNTDPFCVNPNHLRKDKRVNHHSTQRRAA